MRHGESVVNGENHVVCRSRVGDLTELGRTQSAKAARWLADKGISQIRSSPFDRGQQTAQIVAAALNVTPVVDDDLCEMNCGDLEGRSDDAVWEIWAAVYARWCVYDVDARYPGGESYAEAVVRFTRALSKVAPDQTALLITHGGVMRSVIPPLCVNAAAMQHLDHLGHTSMIVLEHYDAERYSCSAWNLVEHLSD